MIVALPEITSNGIDVPFVRLYPNPNEGPIVMDFSDAPFTIDSMHLRLRSIDGRLLVDAPIQVGASQREAVDFSSFGSGAYLLELTITDAQGQSLRQVFRLFQR